MRSWRVPPPTRLGQSRVVARKYRLSPFITEYDTLMRYFFFSEKLINTKLQPGESRGSGNPYIIANPTYIITLVGIYVVAYFEREIDIMSMRI